MSLILDVISCHLKVNKIIVDLKLLYISASSLPFVVCRSCEEVSGKFCNGLLKPAASFCVKLRAYTEDDYRETPCSTSVLMGKIL